MSPASVPTRRAARALCGALALAASIWLSHGVAHAACGADDARAIVGEQWLHGSASADEVVASLAALGPQAIPELFLLVTDGADGPEELDGQRAQRAAEVPALARRALGRAGAKALVVWADALDWRNATTAHKVAALDVLGDQATSLCLPALVRVASSLDPREHMNPRARRALAGALARTLVDERAFVAVGKSARTVKQMRPELGDAIVDAVAATDRLDAVQTLCAFLDQGDARDARVLAHLERLADAHPWWPLEGLGRVAESFLEHPSRDVRKAAAAVLGRVGTLESVPELAPLSEDADATVRRTALWALGEVSGRPGAFEGAERWVAWSVEERQRLKRDLPGIQAALAADDPGVVLAGARELAARRAFRQQGAVVLAELLVAKPELAAPLSSLIVQTGARTAVPSLIDALFSSDARVVDAALRALHALTGEKLPRRGELWVARFGL